MASLALIRLIAKLFPLRIPPDLAQLSPANLRPTYRRWDLLGTAAFLVGAPVAVYLSHEALLAYARDLAPRDSAATYELTAGSGFWYVPAAFVGVVVACVLVHLMYRLMLPDGGRVYRYVDNATVGFDATKMYLAFGILLAAGGVLLAYFAAHTSLRLRPSEIIVTRIFSLEEEHHPYSDVTALKEVRDEQKQNTSFVIEFKNAPKWSTAVEVIFPGPEHKAFLEKQTGKSIEMVVQ